MQERPSLRLGLLGKQTLASLLCLLLLLGPPLGLFSALLGPHCPPHCPSRCPPLCPHQEASRQPESAPLSSSGRNRYNSLLSSVATMALEHKSLVRRHCDHV